MRLSAPGVLWCLMMCLAASGCSDTQPRSRIRGNLTAGSASPPKPNTPPAPNGGSLIIPSSSTAGRPAVGLDTEKICASAVVQTAKNNPTVVFVIDGSGSMCAPFGNGGTRWQSLRRALLYPMSGLIYRLQDAVRFGRLRCELVPASRRLTSAPDVNSEVIPRMRCPAAGQ